MHLDRVFVGVRVGRRGGHLGFTLVELMIVVAIVALLLTVVVPSYRSSIMKARRADAKSALATTAQLMERYFTEHAGAGYTGALVSDTSGANVVAKATSENGHYRLSLTNQTATTFTLTAVPQAGQASDACATFTLDERGVRGVTNTTKLASECW